MILLTLGRVEQLATDTKETVCGLKERVTTQNGKVGKLQEQYAFIRGCVAVLVITILPITINFVSSWIKFTFGK